MCNKCKCGITHKNTGVPGCVAIHTVTARQFLVPKYANDGTLNKVPYGTVIDDTFITGKVNESNALDRWYPLAGKFKNVASERAEDRKEEYDDGSSSNVGQGVKNFQGWLLNYPARAKQALDQFGCGEWGVITIDAACNVIGYSEDGVDTYPIYIEEDSWSARFVPGTATTRPKMQIDFNWDMSISDANIHVYPSNLVTATNLLSIKGLIDVYSVLPTGVAGVEVVSATQVRMRMKSLYGTNITGLVVADLNFNNITTPATFAPSLVTEESEGVYLVTIPAQTTSDVIQPVGSKTQLSFDMLSDTTFVAL